MKCPFPFYFIGACPVKFFAEDERSVFYRGVSWIGQRRAHAPEKALDRMNRMNRILAFGPKNLLSMQASIHEPAAIFRAADLSRQLVAPKS
jgi:hypothetical protein